MNLHPVTYVLSFFPMLKASHKFGSYSKGNNCALSKGLYLLKTNLWVRLTTFGSPMSQLSILWENKITHHHTHQKNQLRERKLYFGSWLQRLLSLLVGTLVLGTVVRQDIHLLNLRTTKDGNEERGGRREEGRRSESLNVQGQVLNIFRPCSSDFLSHLGPTSENFHLFPIAPSPSTKS